MMKKISYILGLLGVISIVISILLLTKEINSENTLLWTTEYQNKEDISIKFEKYNASSFQKIIINKDNAISYIIPLDVYLYKIINSITEYNNNDINILKYNNAVDNDEILNLIDLSDESNTSKVVLKHELDNGNIIYLEKKLRNGSYNERLHIFIKAFEQHYYYVCYQINNKTFSDSFINEVINMDKYKDDSNYLNQDGKWYLYLHANNKKAFELNYNPSKYIKNDDYQGNILSLKVDKDSDKLINIYFYYDQKGIDENINTTFTIKNSQKLMLKDYVAWLYTTIHKEVEYDDYIIMIDNYTKLRVTFPKSLEDKVDINNFLNFTYE